MAPNSPPSGRFSPWAYSCFWVLAHRRTGFPIRWTSSANAMPPRYPHRPAAMSLTGRLHRGLPDDGPDVRPSEDPNRPAAQLEQDLDTTPPTDSGTERTADDIEATADPTIGGESAEEGAVHLTDS